MYLHKNSEGYNENYQADNIEHSRNRWRCAQRTAYSVMLSCYNKIDGYAEDFSSYGESFWKGFYMLDVYYYACETLDFGEESDYIELFIAVSDFPSVQDRIRTEWELVWD